MNVKINLVILSILIAFFSLNFVSSSAYSEDNSIATYYPTDQQCELGYSQSLSIGSDINIKVDGKYFSVKLIQLNPTHAVINVGEEQIVLGIQEEKKINIDNDDKYEIYVKLITIVGNKASITVKIINENIPEVKQNTIESIPVSVVVEKEKINWNLGEITESKNPLMMLWVVLAIILALIFIGVIIIAILNRKPHRKYIKINLKRV